MQKSVVDFASERLIRRAPDFPLTLDQGDADYILATLTAVDTCFDLPPDQRAVPSVPLHLLPAKALTRHLLNLRHRLRPADVDQRRARGALWGAIDLLVTAIAMAEERSTVAMRQGNTIN